MEGVHVVYDNRRVHRIDYRGNEAWSYKHARKRKTIKVSEQNPEIIRHIKDRLYKTAHKNKGFLGSHDRGMRFVTRAQFDNIITPEAVLQVVAKLACCQGLTARDHMQIAQDIYWGTEDGRRSPCCRLLASLIGTGNSEALGSIKTLIDEGLSDTCLPLLIKEVMEEDTLICAHHEHQHASINDMDLESREIFTALCRSFSKDGGKHCHYVLKGGGPLPMRGPLPMEKNDKMNEEGDFGEVFKVEIDPGDRDFDPEHGDSNGTSRADEFDLSLIFAESRALKVPGPDDNGQTKKHLIQPLATFEVYDSNDPEPTFYFLFPLADGNLKQFWEKKRHDATREEHCGWMVEQFYLLAKALQCVHNERSLMITSKRTDSNVFCRHGDIKPSNFLFFEDSQPSGLGRLVLGDFGMARIHRKGFRSSQPAGGRMATISYQAPEFGKEDVVSLKTDIFSLGCVYLEHITYHVSQSKDSVWLKEGVKRWIWDLKQHKDCVEVVYDLLEIIKHDMLEANHQKRINSAMLATELEKVWTKWQRKDSLYGDRHWRESEIGSKAINKPDSSAKVLAISKELLWKQKANRASRRKIADNTTPNDHENLPVKEPTTVENPSGRSALERGKTFHWTMEPEPQSEDDTGSDCELSAERAEDNEGEHRKMGEKSPTQDHVVSHKVASPQAESHTAPTEAAAFLAVEL
ncbi:LOW QUALITY PROTEIN: hypothetical protein QC762_300800 [Podospora pseudocomata]|uniref:Protein kinase domain-containing protein n=1 Tax=Podospora pseudocomata TaxID=2093779 RepID=A0ABR0GHM5_9PEZI|nr:LOW QUALITY PROTEIN: hypothetical protein QC762_300800 [Podospora pseudocomata]